MKLKAIPLILLLLALLLLMAGCGGGEQLMDSATIYPAKSEIGH